MFKTIILAAAAVSALATAHASPADDIAAGLRDRTAYETWRNSLGGTLEYKDGAIWWETHRSDPKPLACEQVFPVNGQNVAELGCLEAKRRLDPTDLLRKSNRDYKTGWNSYVPSAPVVTTTPAPAATQPVNPVTIASAGFVQLGVSGGTYTVPVAVNGHRANFILDSGAAAVVIPASGVLQMINEGTMQASDFIRNDVFVDANGNRASHPVYMLRALTVGSVTIRDVECIGGDDPHTFLLGQSFLSKLPSWSIDNKTGRFVIGG